MDEIMDYPHFEPCPACGAKKSTVTKDRPCSACGCTVDDPYGVLSCVEHTGAVRVDFNQLRLSLDESINTEGEPPKSAAWTRVDYVALCKKRKLARAYASKTGETLLFDEFSCAKCGSGREKVPVTPDGAGMWVMKCTKCGESVSLADIESAVNEIDELSEKETKFQAPDVPVVTLERALKDKATEEL